jgi:Fuc2NAc and GlcNAc transferase
VSWRDAEWLVPAAVVAALLSWLVTRAMRSHALAHRVLDIPNERSSHRVPTPRGGGLGIVVAATAGFIFLTLSKRLEPAALAALLGALPVAAIGFADDFRSVRASIRLAVHLAAAIWAIACLGGLPPLRIASETTLSLGAAGYLLGVLAVVWTLNLFNFMDGIDGIAGLEATFVSWAGGALTLAMGAHSDGGAAAVLFGAACAGFLWWNWPPARIFMGDTGSGYIGFVVAVLAVVAARHSAATLWVWLILGGMFFVDATVTLIRRLARGERVHVAHRSHAYQWLARRWGSHLRVTAGVGLVNVLWLLPCATIATLHPERAVWMVGIAFAPLIVLALAAGAGRREPGAT